MTKVAAGLDLRPDYEAIVVCILRRHVPDRKVLCFGSRATWTAKDYSDLDLAILGDEPLSLDVTSALAEDFRESDLPFKVDLVDWAKADAAFRKIIRRDGITVQAPANSASIVARTRRSHSTRGNMDIARKWTSLPIKAIGKVVGGSTPSTKDPRNFNGDIPWLTPRDLSGTNDRWVSRGARNLSKRGLEACSAQLLPKGAVLLTTRAPIGYVALAANPIATNQGFRSIIVEAKHDPEFLYYWLKQNVAQLERYASGSTFKELSGSALKRISVLLPESKAEQQAIAHILGTLDDKIELNQRMNKTLEAMAQALFKSWFVDFDPVRAKATLKDNASQISVAHERLPMNNRKGANSPELAKEASAPLQQKTIWTVERARAYLDKMDPAITAIFPDSLIDSEIGKIPKGWDVRKLGDFVCAVKGRSYRSKDLRESETALVTLKSFARGGGYRSEGLKSFSGSYKPQQIVKPGEIVIACTDVTQAADVIGRPAIVQATSAYPRLVASLDTLIVRPVTKKMTRAFLYFLTATSRFTSHTYAHTTGTTVLHLDKKAVPSFQFAYPPPRLMPYFHSFAHPTLLQIQNAQQEIESLGSLRNKLLPRLISGELSASGETQSIEKYV